MKTGILEKAMRQIGINSELLSFIIQLLLLLVELVIIIVSIITNKL